MALNWVIDAETHAVTSFGTRTQGYSETEYDELLAVAGLARKETLDVMPGSPVPSDTIAIVAVAQ